jgi:hypothetical protein
MNVNLLPQIVCAWCQRVMRLGCLPISHGMCPSCIVKFEAEAK